MRGWATLYDPACDSPSMATPALPQSNRLSSIPPRFPGGSPHPPAAERARHTARRASRRGVWGPACVAALGPLANARPPPSPPRAVPRRAGKGEWVEAPALGRGWAGGEGGRGRD